MIKYKLKKKVLSDWTYFSDWGTNTIELEGDIQGYDKKVFSFFTTLITNNIISGIIESEYDSITFDDYMEYVSPKLIGSFLKTVKHSKKIKDFK